MCVCRCAVPISSAYTAAEIGADCVSCGVEVIICMETTAAAIAAAESLSIGVLTLLPSSYVCIYAFIKYVLCCVVFTCVRPCNDMMHTFLNLSYYNIYLTISDLRSIFTFPENCSFLKSFFDGIYVYRS